MKTFFLSFLRREHGDQISRSMLNPYAVALILLSASIGYAVNANEDGFSSLLFMYEKLSAIFPFSSIEANASYALHKNSYRLQMLALWLAAPLLIWLSFTRSQDRLYEVNVLADKKLVVLLIYSSICLVLLFVLIVPTPNVGFCGGCEYRSIFWSSVTRGLCFTGIGFASGQVAALLQNSTQKNGA